ncbi:DNA-directed RNA polymerase subunit E'' [Candidatus Woesearchaeota archaeon]|nr:DNA-directed RNA polymerase subunit E'' [Candidatus Woesearchaeota archaeon]
MSSKKACKKCKILVDGNVCPICKGNQFVDNWKGKIYIINAEHSEIAKKIGITIKGEYAIKV